MINLRKFETMSDYSAATLVFPNISYIVESDSIEIEKTAPPVGRTPHMAVVDNIASYVDRIFPDVYDKSSQKWYKLNNLDEYEEYGIYDTSGSSLSDYTTYDGKIAVIGTTEYQYSGGTWVVVGTYTDSATTWEITDMTRDNFRGQTLQTTFKIPKADIESAGFFDMRIREQGGGNGELSMNQLDYTYRDNDWNEIRGNVTQDSEYYYYTMTGVTSIVVEFIDYWNMEPIHIIFNTKNISVEYPTLSKPLGAVSFSAMSDAITYTETYYGLPATIENDYYIFNSSNLWEIASATSKNYFGFKANDNNVDIKYNNNNNTYISASYDFGNTWVSADKELPLPLGSGATVLLKATTNDKPFERVSSTRRFEAKGNIMSLLYGDNFEGETSLSGKDYAFYGLFSACSGLTSAENLVLPATTLTKSCYSSMFQGCTSLTTAPTLPATTLASGCYYYMFEGCTSLNHLEILATDISATNCITGMLSNVASAGTIIKDCGLNFKIPSGWTSNCTYNDYLTFVAEEDGTFSFSQSGSGENIQYSLDSGSTWTSLGNKQSTPTVQSGNTIMWRAAIVPSNNTYYDIYGIGRFSSTGRFEAKGNLMHLLQGNLNSLQGNDYAFNMLFRFCSGLTSIDNLVLPSTTLTPYCYQHMFENCTSLTSIPSGLLPATTLAYNCYQEMFKDCSGLTTVPSDLLPATTLSKTCYQQMFNGCSSLTTAPELPATTLTDWCYWAMFDGCSSLTTAPVLPATTLVEGCYGCMFEYCVSLNNITCLATDLSGNDCTSNWFRSVPSGGTFIKASDMNDWSTGESGIPNGWTVVDYQP